MPKYYLLDENKNLVEGFDKEGFLALLEQAIEQGSLENIDENSAVASKLRSVLNGTTHHIEFVTQAQYNQLVADEELVVNTWYFIIDDTSYDDLITSFNNYVAQFEALSDEVAELREVVERGTKLAITDFSFSMSGLAYWNASYNTTNASTTLLSLIANAGNSYDQSIKILPIDTISSVASVEVTEVSSTIQGLFTYTLRTIDPTSNVIELDVSVNPNYNICNPYYSQQTSRPLGTTTLQVVIKDVYGNTITKSFPYTISYRYWARS